jgi:hypothetical protein
VCSEKASIRKNLFSSRLAGRLIAVFHKSPPAISAKDLQKAEFKTSTQRLGVRFTEKIRQTFRNRWIKKL